MVFDSQAKFQSEKVMADVYLAIAVAGANTLIVMGVAIAFVLIWKAASSGHSPHQLAASFIPLSLRPECLTCVAFMEQSEWRRISDTAITRPKEQARSLHFCARSKPVCFGNAKRKPECTYYQDWQLNHPGARLGPSRWSRSSLRMGPRPPLRLATSSPWVRLISERGRLDWRPLSFRLTI